MSWSPPSDSLHYCNSVLWLSNLSVPQTWIPFFPHWSWTGTLTEKFLLAFRTELKTKLFPASLNLVGFFPDGFLRFLWEGLPWWLSSLSLRGSSLMPFFALSERVFPDAFLRSLWEGLPWCLSSVSQRGSSLMPFFAFSERGLHWKMSSAVIWIGT